MGDAAELWDDTGHDARLAHLRGECDPLSCEWCDGEDDEHKPTLRRPPCPCPHPDRFECLRRRYRLDGLPESGTGEECECCCHDEDEGGFSQWWN